MRMGFFDMIMALASRQGDLAYRTGDRMIAFSSTGWLMAYRGGKAKYATMSTMDVLANNWEIVTSEQLAAAAAQDQQGELP